ncbi:MAG: AbrB family transcriptional regulator [Acidobacteria bacterium]|nr:MAG: AbrB family transcriptional regulator [Acidobacteriota bacterium]MCL4287391.1 AbrB/MazE/SpoVT family DNA-binding domain-containing protein [Thermoleophilia bacterium]
MATRTTFVTIQQRGVLALPSELRKRHHLDEPGAQVEVAERDDGVIELRPHVPVPADQKWFWTDRWQEREHEADADIAAGRVLRSEDVDDFLAELDGGE